MSWSISSEEGQDCTEACSILLYLPETETDERDLLGILAYMVVDMEKSHGKSHMWSGDPRDQLLRFSPNSNALESGEPTN